MATRPVVVRIRLRWWLRIYLQLLGAACVAFGKEPRQSALNRVIRRGVLIELRSQIELEA